MYIGLGLSVLAGVLDGSTALSMHFVTKWRWENIWLVFCTSMMILIPFVVGALTIPDIFGFYASAQTEIVLSTFRFGLLFGIGILLFGLGITRVGMGLGNAIVVSFTAVNGSLIPLIFLHPDKLGTRSSDLIFTALAILVVGITLCSLAARRRKEEKPLLALQKPNLILGIIICASAGFFSPCINLAFAFGQPLSAAAVAAGAGEVGSGMAVLIPALLGSFATCLACCGYLLTRNRTWLDFALPGTKSHWFYGFVMGCCNGGAFVVYGVATAFMGSMGTVVGWPVYMGLIILTANFWGLVRGEWRGSDTRTYWQLAIGVMLILIAVYIVSHVQ
jgi:L-rhamnose-H+ transport protein